MEPKNIFLVDWNYCSEWTLSGAFHDLAEAEKMAIELTKENGYYEAVVLETTPGSIRIVSRRLYFQGKKCEETTYNPDESVKQNSKFYKIKIGPNSAGLTKVE